MSALGQFALYALIQSEISLTLPLAGFSIGRCKERAFIFRFETLPNSLIPSPNLLMLVIPSITMGVLPTFCASLRQEIVNKSEDGFKIDSSLKANSSISFTGSMIKT